MPIQHEIADLSAAELRHLVGRREVPPVQIVEACLARVERFNPAVNAVVTLNERALDDARALEREAARGNIGPLCGLPVGIKDVTPVAGLRTTYGSPVDAHNVPTQDALIVRRLRDASAVILGKTNCPEFAAGGGRARVAGAGGPGSETVMSQAVPSVPARDEEYVPLAMRRFLEIRDSGEGSPAVAAARG